MSAVEEQGAVAEFAFSLWEYIQTEKEFLGIPSALDRLSIVDFVKFFVKESSCYPVNRGPHAYTQTTPAFADYVDALGNARDTDSD